jgi:hypothetical protein
VGTWAGRHRQVRVTRVRRRHSAPSPTAKARDAGRWTAFPVGHRPSGAAPINIELSLSASPEVWRRVASFFPVREMVAVALPYRIRRSGSTVHRYFDISLFHAKIEVRIKMSAAKIAMTNMASGEDTGVRCGQLNLFCSTTFGLQNSKTKLYYPIRAVILL